MRNIFAPSFFTFGELTATNTGLNNQPKTFCQFEAIVKLGHGLDYIREVFGHPIIVNSAFRTPEVNKAVCGSQNSFHLHGRAADIRPADPDLFDEFVRVLRDLFVEHLLFCEFLVYRDKGFVHIAFKQSFLVENFERLMQNRYGN